MSGQNVELQAPGAFSLEPPAAAIEPTDAAPASTVAPA